MDFFYAPPEQWLQNSSVEITGQEARHILKVLRYGEGDSIYVADGAGRIAACIITGTTKNTLTAEVKNLELKPESFPKKVLAAGLIKVRERFDFAVEKAVELGADEICIFVADHSQRKSFNIEKTAQHIISAFKQSGRFWLPELLVKKSLDEVLAHYRGFDIIMAHEKTETSSRPEKLLNSGLLLVGPEGGFSEREVLLAEQNGGQLVSLGNNRLRAETAVAALLAQYLFE